MTLPPLDRLPDGWAWDDHAVTAPNGFRWANNRESRFSPDFVQALIRTEEKPMKEDTCFLCKRNRHAGRLEVHHIFGAANRQLSDRLGLTVTLCEECHRAAPWSVHQSAETAQYLHEIGQRKAMEEQGWTAEQFAEFFGKNYLEGNA